MWMFGRLFDFCVCGRLKHNLSFPYEKGAVAVDIHWITIWSCASNLKKNVLKDTYRWVDRGHLIEQFHGSWPRASTCLRAINKNKSISDPTGNKERLPSQNNPWTAMLQFIISYGCRQRLWVRVNYFDPRDSTILRRHLVVDAALLSNHLLVSPDWETLIWHVISKHGIGSLHKTIVWVCRHFLNQ